MTDHHSRAQLVRDLKTDKKWRRQDLQGHSRVSARAWVRQSGPNMSDERDKGAICEKKPMREQLEWKCRAEQQGS